MDRHLKDPVAYNRDYQNFIQNLQKFHGSKGTGFKRVPFFGGKELDLFLLYKTVTSLGGFVKVTEEKKWREAAKCFNLPVSCTNAAFSLRQYYLRYLASYERYHFFGEDVDDAMAEMRKSSIAGSMQNSAINFGTFSSNNQFADTPTPVKPGPLGEPRVNNFDRLVFSLKSGLPNEVDFALNICTLLSNVTNSIFNLAKAPNIVDLMLAHVGIFANGSSSMRELYKEWYQESDRDFVKFWRDSIDDEALKEIYGSGCGIDKSSSAEINTSFTESSLFSRNTSVINSVEANRALQVCVILHNFSYEGLNCLYIAGHEAAKRFLFLCAGTHLSSLRKCALDTLDNLAEMMTLPIIQDVETQTYLRVLHSFLFSKDRARKVRAISVIAKLAAQAENEDVLSEALSHDIYEELINCLTIPDIQLILNSLDALYYLSDLGETTATAIVTVYRSIDILVCLVRVHAESYGNRAISGFRIVENKNSIHAQKHAAAHQSQRNMAHQIQRGTALSANPQLAVLTNHVRNSPKLPSQQAVMGRHDQTKTDDTEEVEPEIFAARWISAFYELAPGSEIRRSKVFADYTESCKELGRKGILNVHSFFKILGLVIPGQYWKQSEIDKEDLLITGIKQRSQPLFVKNRVMKAPVRVPDLSHTQSEQIHPIRPIPIAAQQIQSHQLKVPNSNAFSAIQSVQSSVPMVVAQGINQQGQHVLLQHPGMVQMQIQGPRQQQSIAPVSVPDAANLPVKQSDATQKMPLQLLQQHVNAQGNAQVLTPQKIDTPQTSSQEPLKQILFPVTPSSVNQQIAGGQKFIPIQLVQSQFLQQVQIPGQPHSTMQPAVVNATLGSQSTVLQSQVPASVTTILNGSAPLTDAQSTQHNIVVDPKLTPTQKPSTAKEKHERKKAIKAAREIINADIRASNQDPLTQCQNLTDKIQKEMQQNFLQFHVHQQSIQAIQNQLQQVILQNQQSKLPQNVMDDIQTRVRNHHAQMQMHYQKLQQLQMLLQQVQLRLSQEQKSANTETQNDIAAEQGSSTLQRGFNSPRILKPQSATNAVTLTSKTSFQSTETSLESDFNSQSKTQEVLTYTQTNAVSDVSSTSSASLIPPSNQGSLINAVKSSINTIASIDPQNQITVAPVSYQQQISNSVVANSNPGTAFSSSSSAATISNTPSQIIANSKSSTTLQFHPGQTASIPLPVFTNSNSQNSLQSGIVAGTNKPFIQVPIVANIQSSVSSINTKPGTFTQNTPILPRPQQTTIPVSHPAAQSIQKSGRALLLTMPVTALSQQTLLLQDNKTVSGVNQQPTVVKQTSQGVQVISTNRILLQNSPFNRAGPNTISNATDQSVTFVDSSKVQGIVQGSSANKLTSAFTANATPQSQRSVGEPRLSSSNKASISVTGIQVLANGPVSQHEMQSQSASLKKVSQLETAVTPLLTNGGIATDEQTSSVASISTKGCLASQNGSSIQQGSNTCVESVISQDSKAHLTDNNTTSKSSANYTPNNKQSIKSIDVSASKTTSDLSISDSTTRNNGFEHFTNNKRSFEHVLESSSIRENKKLKTIDSKEDSSSLEQAIDLNGKLANNTDHILLDKSKTDLTRVRVNGAFTDMNNYNGQSNRIGSMENNSNSIASVSSSLDKNQVTKTVETSYLSEQQVPKTDSTAQPLPADSSTPTDQLPGSNCFTEQTNEPNSDVKNMNQTKGPGSELVNADTNTSVKKSDDTADNLVMETADRNRSVELLPRKSKRHEESKHKQRVGKNCLWAGCSSCFSTVNNLLTHMVFTHAPAEGQLKACKVPGCKPTKRPRGSMICHFKQVHCKTHSQGTDDDQQLTLPELLFPKVVDTEPEDESPVTRSVRLTAALILRNIARNSSYGRQEISAHESKLVVAAMSSSEASKAISGCLEELTRKRRKSSDCFHDDEAS